MPGIGEYSRLANNPSRPMGFSTRQPLIAHMERIAKGAAQNLMESTSFAAQEDEEPIESDEKRRRGEVADETRSAARSGINQGDTSRAQAHRLVIEPQTKAGKGIWGLLQKALLPGTLAAVAALGLPAFYGRRGREIVPPEGVPPLGAPGTGDLTGGVSNAIERLQGIAGGAQQLSQYIPPGMGELGRRAAMIAAGKMG